MGIECQNLFESAPDPYLLLLPGFTVAGITNAYLSATSGKRDELISRPVHEVLPPLAAPAVQGSFQNALLESLRRAMAEKTAGKLGMRQFAVASPSGTLMCSWDISITPVLAADKEVQYIILKLCGEAESAAGETGGIDEKQQQQNAIMQLNKELDSFTYSVSHDLRAPLRAISGYSQMLDEDYAPVLDAEGKRLLRTIEENASRMGLLIDNLLAFSRIGRRNVIISGTDMNMLVQETLSELAKAGSCRAAITVAPLHRINSDHGLMYHVLVNLIGNAIKYSSKKDNPQIEIKSEQKDNEVIFSVSDNGVGFDMKYANKLFGMFQRLHGSDEFDGAGVGLAIVHRIIQKHGGRVWADGKVNEGATFYFSIPLN